MKFFIDTANLNEIREAASLGILDGVTTNPSLIAKEAKEGKVDFHEHIHTICELVNGPVSAEVTDETLDGMLKQGRELARIHPNVTVKVPLTKDGLKACSALTKEGTKVNVTLCFSAGQALLAAKSGATFISPFVGRLDDIGDVGMDVIRDIVQIYDNYGYGTEVLAASIRSPLHVIEAAKYGADVATIPFKIIDMLFRHPLTDKGMEQFMADWKNGGLK